MTTHDDEAFDRLRHADPAAGTSPDLDAIRAAVGAATGVHLAGAGATGVPLAAAATPHDELAARRHRTRARWFQVAAAVVGAAVVGTGGYLVGGAGSGPAVAGALPALSLTNGASGGAESAAGAADFSASAPMAGGKDSARGIYPGGWYGRTVFTGSGLSTDGGSATAYGFDATSVGNADTAARIAAALGVTGDPRVEWGSWVVGPNDGTGPTVSVYGSGTVDFSFYDPTRDPWQCGQTGGTSEGSTGTGAVPPAEPQVEPGVAPDSAASGAGATGEAVAPLPAVAPGVCDTGTTPTGDAAIAKAREVLTAAGIDVSAAQVTVDDSQTKTADMPGAAYVNVGFQQVVDGQLTGYGWWVSLVGDGVQSASGPLAPLVQLGSYDVISAAQAVDRLNDPRFGSSGGVIAYASGMGVAEAGVAEPGMVASEPSQDPTIPPAATPGAAISWPVAQVTLTSARLGLAPATTVGGAQVLVPAYELTDGSGATWSVIAVVDAQLDFTAQQ